MGLPTIAVPPAQPPQPYLRHGCGPELAIERRVERNEWMSGHRHRVGETSMAPTASLVRIRAES